MLPSSRPVADQMRWESMRPSVYSLPSIIARSASVGTLDSVETKLSSTPAWAAT